MSVISKDSTTFQFSTLDWQKYLSHRPPYPNALYDLIFSYHANHNGQFSSALDVGAGIGVATSKLLPHFDHVTLSDPNEPYLSQAHNLYEGIDQSKLSFLQEAFEKIEAEALPTGKVDLIVAGTCIHWMKPDDVHKAAARLLNPGGTFAAWTYGVPVTLYKIGDAAFEDDNDSHRVGGTPASGTHQNDSAQSSQPRRSPKVSPRVQEAVRRAESRYYEIYEQEIESLDDPNSFAAKGNARYDCYPFDAHDWRDVIRLHDHTDVSLFGDRFPTANSAVQADETTVVLRDEEQNVAGIRLRTGFVSKEGGFDDWKKMMCNWVETLDLEVNAMEEIEQVRLAMEADGLDRVRMEWPFALIMASKR